MTPMVDDLTSQLKEAKAQQTENDAITYWRDKYEKEKKQNEDNTERQKEIDWRSL